MRILSPRNRNRRLWPERILTSGVTDDFFGDFDSMFNTFLRPPVSASVDFLPNCDVDESDSHYMLSFDIPGVKQKDIHIDINENQLTISGERNKEMNTSGKNGAFATERIYGKFQRSFTLPSSIDREKIEAQYEDGVLNVALPKVEREKGRSVEIQPGGAGLFGKLLGVNKNKKETVKNLKSS